MTLAPVAVIRSRNGSLADIAFGRRMLGPATTRTLWPRDTRRATIGRINGMFPPPSNIAIKYERRRREDGFLPKV